MTTLALQRCLDRPIVIVGGSGGVGKTSVSAALGIRRARKGGKTLVLTIDPARRLADALGLDEIHNDAVDITPLLRSAGMQPQGQLFAMMLNVENTFHNAVRRCTPELERQEAIFRNPLYASVATRLSGSQEYASMQRLLDIVSEGSYDQIILDTPPTTHALDFLTAPQRLAKFFDSRITSVITDSAMHSRRHAKFFKQLFLRALDRLSGEHVIHDIATFFDVAEPLLSYFQRHAAAADALLKQADTSFLIVAGPSARQLDEVRSFQNSLGALGITADGVIVNRWMKPMGSPQKLERDVPLDGLAGTIHAWSQKMERLAQDQTREIDHFSEIGDTLVARIPVCTRTVSSIAVLAEMANGLDGHRGR